MASRITFPRRARRSSLRFFYIIVVVLGESNEQLIGLLCVEAQVRQPALLPCCDHVVSRYGPVGRID